MSRQKRTPTKRCLAAFWSAPLGLTLYVGWIITVGRSKVTAIGDEVNEAARIEACATGGRTFASKLLVERLNTSDAQALAIDSQHATYTLLGDLDTATDKARRGRTRHRRLRRITPVRSTLRDRKQHAARPRPVTRHRTA